MCQLTRVGPCLCDSADMIPNQLLGTPGADKVVWDIAHAHPRDSFKISLPETFSFCQGHFHAVRRHMVRQQLQG